MVEGGARIIASLFAARSATGKPVIDSLIVTVAPIFVGVDGVGYGVGHYVHFFSILNSTASQMSFSDLEFRTFKN